MKPKIDDTFSYDFSFTKEQVLLFAQISGDTNPIHVNEDYANTTNFKKCIVHGYFIPSIFSKIYGTLLYPEEHILISQSSKHIAPIYTDIEYSAIISVKELLFEKNRVLFENYITEKGSIKKLVIGEALLLNKKHYK